MKKVLILNPYLPTMGGGEKHMGYLCKFIEEYYKGDVEIDILVHNYNNIDINSKDYVTVNDLNKQFGLTLNHTKIRKLNIPHSDNIKIYLQNKNVIENITKEYDIFINFMFLSKHIGKAKLNIYSCMFPPKRYEKEVANDGMIKRIGAKYFDAKFYNSYKAFISNSAFTNHWLSEYWQPSPKNKIVYPPVFSNEEIQGRYEEEKKENIIISVGRFFVGAHSKKQYELVKMFVDHNKEFKNYEYHLVGALSNYEEDIEYFSKIKELASQVSNVFIHENYPFDKLIDLYRRAKIFWHGTGYKEDENLNPEKMEHFGITTVEAMSFGAVPVVINKGGQTETVIDGVNGYRWNNEQECIENTLKLTQNDELRKNMAEKCIEEAKKYSIEAFYDANRRIFDEL